MTQRPACGEKLPLGMSLLDFGSQDFGHWLSVTGTRKKKSKAPLFICLSHGDNVTKLPDDATAAAVNKRFR
jgi:hypothetical protein